MNRHARRLAVPAATLLVITACAAATSQAPAGTATGGVRGWLDWRGPLQSGVSLETGLIDAIEVGGEGHLWSYELHGRGTPVVADGRVYTLGYEGEGEDLHEVLVCLDERTGELLWEDRWRDFLSDVIYDRYSIGSPTVDPETGDLFVQETSGVLKCYSPDGEQRWALSMMEELGRLTFPNGRTGAPIVDGDLVIVHVINAHWGRTEGPARDRFYAFDKRTGEVVWGCTPGVGPKDSSFSHPVLEDRGGRRVLYAGTGCGNVVALDARTGEALWRFQASIGGINSSPLIHGDRLIEIHGRENTDSSKIGRMVSLQLGALPEDGAAGPVVLPVSAEHWRNELVAFTSSPVLVGDRVYVTIATGELCCIDADSGDLLWHHKLAPDQIHASPLYADGKLYVPMTNGSFHVLRPTDEGPEILCSVQLEGSCLGAPAVCNGRIYVHTTERLYCFGAPGAETVEAPPPKASGPPGDVVRLQVVPADVLLQPGEPATFRVRSLDAAGNVVSEELPTGGWKLGPPTLLQALAVEGGGGFAGGSPGVGTLTYTAGNLSAGARVRVVASLPWTEDFEGAQLDKPGSDGSQVAFPPSSWIGVFKKWEVVDFDGSKVLRKTLNTPLFQRAMGFCGHPDASNYTVQVDLMTDGNRRIMGQVGVVIQRYIVQLMGNRQSLQVSSNDERLMQRVPFRWKPGVWYTLRTRVDVADDGAGLVRAKAWQRGEPEPEEWLIEVEHANAHTHGAPGLFGFTPQSRFHVYVDNLSVTPND